MTAILVVEADRRISTAVGKALRAEGFSTMVVTDGLSGYRYARRGDVDLIVLDARSPGTGGLEMLRRLRADGCTLPALLLTNRPGQTAATLDTSTEQFVSAAPLRCAELLAAVRTRLGCRGEVPSTVLSYGGLRLDLRTRRAYVGDYWVDLSVRECDLAETFLRNPGQVLSRSHLLRQVWGGEEPESNVVDVYVRYLRRKLGSHWFVASRGVGYRLQAAACHYAANSGWRTSAARGQRPGGRARRAGQPPRGDRSGAGIALATSAATPDSGQ